jgi:hypothetical protein
VTNGQTLPNVDGRLRITRRFRDIASAVAADQGGADNLSEARKQLIRRFSAAAVLAEELESHMARGEEINVERHALLCSTLVRIGQRLGLDRIARDISPTLADIMRESEQP